MKRLLFPLGAFLLAVGNCAGILLVALSRAVAPRPAARPPLADGLPRDFREADRVFAARIPEPFRSVRRKPI